MARQRSTHPDHDTDLPPPAPHDAALTRDVEDQIRADERARVQAELAALAGDHERPVEDMDATDTRRGELWDEWARGESAPTPVPATAPRGRTGPGEPDDTGDVNLAALRADRDLAADRHVHRDHTDHDADLDADRSRHDRTHDTAEVVTDERVEVRSFSIGQAITMLVGVALAAWGVIALVATGIDTPLDQPVEAVFGFDHTPWMGLAEVAAGALLILAAIRPQGRWLAGLIGLALVAVGVMIVVEMDWTVDELASEPDFGWIPIGAGALALLGAALTPPRRRVVTDVDRVDHDDRSDDGYYRA
jgi:hypothetical protein